MERCNSEPRSLKTGRMQQGLKREVTTCQGSGDLGPATMRDWILPHLSELMSDSSPAAPERHVAQCCLDVSLCDPEQGTGRATLHSDPQICGADKWVLFQTAQFVVICDTAVAICYK